MYCIVLRCNDIALTCRLLEILPNKSDTVKKGVARKGIKNMKNLSKAYNHATAELDALVRETRRIHHEAVDALEQAEAENSKWNRPVNDLDYQAKAAQAAARANYEAAKKNCFRSVTGAWDDYDLKAKAIRAELVNAIADASVKKAAGIDQNAIALLGSGLMTGRDYEQMAKDYAENPTVLSLMRESAEKYADRLHDDFRGVGHADEINAVRRVIESAKTSGERELESFDNLVTAARNLGGRPVGGFREADRVYAKTALDSWGTLTAGLIGNEDESEGGEDE